MLNEYIGIVSFSWSILPIFVPSLCRVNSIYHRGPGLLGQNRAVYVLHFLENAFDMFEWLCPIRDSPVTCPKPNWCVKFEGKKIRIANCYKTELKINLTETDAKTVQMTRASAPNEFILFMFALRGLVLMLAWNLWFHTSYWCQFTHSPVNLYTPADTMSLAIRKFLCCVNEISVLSGM